MFDHILLFLKMLFCYIGAIEVAAVRGLCKTALEAIEKEPEESFKFACSPVIARLHKFTRVEHLLWVVRRLECDVSRSLAFARPRCLLQGTIGLHPRFKPTMVQQGHRLVRTFLFHPDVQALLVRLDCYNLMRCVPSTWPYKPQYTGHTHADIDLEFTIMDFLYKLQLDNKFKDFICNFWVFFPEMYKRASATRKEMLFSLLLHTRPDAFHLFTALQQQESERQHLAHQESERQHLARQESDTRASTRARKRARKRASQRAKQHLARQESESVINQIHKKKGYLPKVLLLQLDNTTKQNKGKYLFGFLP
jgi:hypothetical protein